MSRDSTTLLCLLLLVTACGGGSGASSDPADYGDSFLAFAPDFYDFHGWQSFDVTKDAAPGTVHPDAMLIEYLKFEGSTPAPGSTEWPLRTIIVKEGTDGDPLTRNFFAMVKRGGGYNSSGANGWEWFELQNQPDMLSVTIVWRGVGPPAGETYGGDPNAGCNTCHVACGNDSVCAPAVQLSQF